MTRPFNLLFDLDGTLTDPMNGITRCIRFALDEMGFDAPPAADLTWCIGPPLRESFVRLLGAEDKADDALAYYRRRFASVGMFENKVYPEIPSVLEKLNSDGHRLFVATSKPHVYARPILEHFGLDHWFEAIHGSELDGARVRKPDLLSHILKTENLDAASSVMIGDRRHDVEGARATGVRAVAVTWGYGDGVELEDADPDAFCDAPSAIPKVLAGWIGT